MTARPHNEWPSPPNSRVAPWLRWACCALLVAGYADAVRAQRAVTVSGYVSAKGAPVRGARVSVSELGVGSTSDDEGRYSFIIGAAAVHGQTVTVTARHRRYDTKAAPIKIVGNPIMLDFDLQPMTAPTSADDALPMAVPAGRSRSSAEIRSSASISDVITGSALLETSGRSSVAGELEGRVPGVTSTDATTQGGSVRLTLRGPHALFTDDQPLFVLNGVPVDNSGFAAELQRFGQGGFDYGSSQQDFNLADIVSIHVLKGPGAAALFGSSAANGAVLIETRDGRDLNGLAVSASQQLTLDAPLRLPAFQNTYGQGLGGQFAFVNGQGAGVNDSVAQSWGPPLDGRPIAQFSPSEAARPDVRFWQAYPSNVKSFFSSGQSLTTDVAVAGSNDRTNGRFSVSNRDIRGIVPNSYFTRQTGALLLTRALTEQFRVTVNAQAIRSRGMNRPGTGDDGANPMIGLLQLGRQVDAAALKTQRIDATGNQISWNYAGQNNPYFGAFENGNVDERQRLIGQLSATYDLSRWLDAVARVGTDSYRDARDFHVATGWMGGYVDYAGRGDFSKGGVQNENIHAQRSDADLLLRARLRQEHDLQFAVTAGASQRRDNARVEAIATDELATPGVYDVNNAAKAVLPARSATAVRTVAALGSLEARVRDVASVSINERAERSSLLSKAHDGYLNSSLSGALSLTRLAPVLRLGGLVDDGQLHAQWARASDASLAITALNFPVTSFAGIPRATVPNVIADSAIHPEVTTGWEGGATVQTRSGMTLDLTYYAERRRDQLLVLSVPLSSGFSSAVLNGGELTNSGIEARVDLPLLRLSRLTWNMSGTYARNTNRVQSLPSGYASLPLGPELWGMSIEARAGYPLGALVGRRFLRDAASGQLLLRDGHPLPDTLAGPQVLGSALPRWTAGLGNTLHYRALELNVLIDVRHGGKIFSATNLLGSYAGTLATTAFRPDTGLLLQGIDVVSGKANTTHVSTENYYHALLPVQERWVYDASFARLREARLTVTVPPRILFLGSNGAAKLSLFGSNLFLWTRVPNIDPETVFSTSSFQGMELGQLPGVRSVGLQLSVTP